MNDEMKIIDGVENYNFVNHNETDYKKFNEFNEKHSEKFEKLVVKQKRQERISNLKLWESKLPQRWRGAALTKMDLPAAQIAVEKINENPRGSFYISGPASSGKTFLSYGIARRLIGRGIITPSEILIMSEDQLLGYAVIGFKGREELNKILQPTNKMFIIDNVGMKEHYTQNQLSFIEQVIDHVYTNSLILVFTSSFSARYFSEKISSSAGAKLAHLVSGRILRATGSRNPILDDWTPEEHAYNEKISKEQEDLNVFAD